MSASPWPFEEIQPDGTRATLFVRGDEHYQWLSDSGGYTVLRENGWLVYAHRDHVGRLRGSGLRVGTHDPRLNGLSPDLKPAREFQTLSPIGAASPTPGFGETASPTLPGPTPVNTGTYPNLVVLLRFANHAARSVPPEADLDVLMNAAGGHATLAPTGSVRDAFYQNSYGQLTLDSTVAYWITLPETEAYYANAGRGLTTRTHEALRYALGVLDADPSFSFLPFDENGDGAIDAITFLHSGYGAEWGGTASDGAYYMDRIWSHKWSISGGGWVGSEGVRVSSYHISPAIWGTTGSTIGRIGVICHETGHFFGLPDLYDGDDTDGDGRTGQGLGSYCLMANSWGFDGTQRFPPHMSAWCKLQLGWATAQSVATAGQYLLRQWTQYPDVYKIAAGYPAGEYLLVENRQRTGLDSDMPQGGLAVYHVDEAAPTYTSEGFPTQSGWPANGRHYRIAMVQADGQYEMERGLDRGDAADVFHAGGVSSLGPNLSGTNHPNTDAYQGGVPLNTGNRLYNISASGASMTFSYERTGIPLPPSAPSNLGAVPASATSINLAWSDTSTNESGFGVERSLDGISFTPLAQVATNVVQYSDTTAASGTTHYYRVRAFNPGGNSAYTSTAWAVTPSTVPAAPVAFAASALTGAKANVTWRDVSTNETGFRLQRATNASFTLDLKTFSLRPSRGSYADSKLTVGTTYYYRVQSFNAAGASAYVGPASIVAKP
ncbi:MAG: M6 family metalloprotease domain-containing protein [Verrucomicrobiales bacterium]|nr:M6 family metalloprotease domain-containing protein [Verrucomicrobiales bacterium]